MEQINKNRQAIVLVLLLMFLLLLGFYRLAFMPEADKVSAQQREIGSLRAENDAAMERITRLRTEALDEGESELLAALPAGDGAEQLIAELKAVSDRTGAKLKDITFTDSELSTPASFQSQADIRLLRELRVSAVIEGDYGEIHRWLESLNGLSRTVTVTAFSFQQPYEIRTELNPGSLFPANISFTAYYEAQPE